MQQNRSWIRHAAGYQNRVRNRNPVITVVGAASKQGRSVAHALLDSGRDRVRALTRRRDSQPAQVLAQRGAEVVVAPLQPGVQADLTAATRGSAGAF
jgi:NAD(P)-dependent dehydrogenase (short-subunit alcohol dehydrogenase family)